MLKIYLRCKNLVLAKAENLNISENRIPVYYGLRHLDDSYCPREYKTYRTGNALLDSFRLKYLFFFLKENTQTNPLNFEIIEDEKNFSLIENVWLDQPSIDCMLENLINEKFILKNFKINFM